MEIGTQIRLARLERDMKQKRLAELAMLSPSSLSQIERGRRNPTYAQLEKLSRVLDMPLGTSFDKELGQPREPVLRQPSMGEIISMISNYPRLGRLEKRIVIDALRSFKRKWELENLDFGGEDSGEG